MIALAHTTDMGDGVAGLFHLLVDFVPDFHQQHISCSCKDNAGWDAVLNSRLYHDLFSFWWQEQLDVLLRVYFFGKSLQPFPGMCFWIVDQWCISSSLRFAPPKVLA